MNNPINRAQFVLTVAWQEFKTSLGGPLVPIIFGGLTLYMWLILLNADYMREMGTIGIPRNSANISYLMASGQSMWLYFAWAWLFAQAINRDQQSQLHEVVLAAPVSLTRLLISRYLGILGAALILGSAVFLGLVTSPVLVWTGLLPADAIGPLPWASMFWGWLLFIVVNAAGSGALFVSASIWTRSPAGAFTVAAIIAVIWMIAMVVLRGGNVDLFVASVIDPSGFAEVERQSDLWTPTEKQFAIMELTPGLLLNRFIWLVPPLMIFAFIISRVSREILVLERKHVDDEAESNHQEKTSTKTKPVQIEKLIPNWWSACLSEFAWHLKLIVNGFGFRLTVVLLLFVGIMGTWVNFILHSDGPLLPYAPAVMPFMSEFFYIIVLFIVIGFVGSLVRRDDRQGFNEWVDSAPAPLGVRVFGKAAAAMALVVILSSITAFSAILLSLIIEPYTINFVVPFVFALYVQTPALAEMCALALFTHALIRHPGTAYAVSIMLGFIAILNHELSVVEYPPAQIGIPVHIHISELTGWQPWLPVMFSANNFKFALILFLVALAWLFWSRGTALLTSDRAMAFRQRLLQAPGIMAALSLLAFIAVSSQLYHHLIIEGEYESSASSMTGDAEWERTWWEQATSYSIRQGTVDIKLDPKTRSGSVSWQLKGVNVDGAYLHATLPHGITVEQITVANQLIEFVLDEDHLAIPLGNCSYTCDMKMELSVLFQNWPEETPPWLEESGIWLRAENILPRLGHDPDRLLRAPADRIANGLPKRLPVMPAAKSLTPMLAVAPVGNWRWQIQVTDGHLIGDKGQLTGPLDFAVVWTPVALNRTEIKTMENHTYSIWHHALRTSSVENLADDISNINQCVAKRLGTVPVFTDVVQVPSDIGEIGLFNKVLWLPEDRAWEIAGTGFGQLLRLNNLARHFVQRVLVQQTDLRHEPGAEWLLEGISGWVALNCVETIKGIEAGIALRERQGELIIDGLGTSRDPITTIADALGEWLSHYATLAFDSWSLDATHMTEQQFLQQLLPSLQDNSFYDAMIKSFGKKDATMFLGPPRSYDVSITQTEEALQIKRQRWVWNNGGWHDDDTKPLKLVRKTTTQPVEIEWVPPGGKIDTLDSEPSSGFYYFDALPAFEKTIRDNLL